MSAFEEITIDLVTYHIIHWFYVPSSVVFVYSQGCAYFGHFVQVESRAPWSFMCGVFTRRQVVKVPWGVAVSAAVPLHSQPYSIVWMYHILCICWSIDRYLDCFCFLAVMNSAPRYTPKRNENTSTHKNLYTTVPSSLKSIKKISLGED